MPFTESPPSAAAPSTRPTAPVRRPRLEFLDGVRGLCALYVVFAHARLFTGHGVDAESYSPAFAALGYAISFGNYAVTIFIVLSGFCLAIPVALSPARTLRGGFRDYMLRRARRILPPYYAALSLFLLLVTLLPVLQTPQGTAWDSKIPLTWDALMAHLLLVHNLYPGWMFKLDGPMWSVATEWQIYFFFPLLLLLWRRLNLAAAAGFALVLSLVPQLFLPSQLSFRWLHPWFFGVFALGMAGAVVVFSPAACWQRVRERLPWRVLAWFGGALALASLVIGDSYLGLPTYLNETLLGVGSCLVLVYCALSEQAGRQTALLGFLNHRRVVFIGTFSYSLYLIHSPLLGLFNLLTLELPLTSDLRLLMMLLVALPLAVGASYLFYLLTERRVLPGHLRAGSGQGVTNKDPDVTQELGSRNVVGRAPASRRRFQS